MADDMGYSDIGCYGGEIDTPNIDQLAAGGMRFRQFYNEAKCGPSRAALLTGQFSNQGQLKNGATFAEILKSAGYRTLMAGKWHNTPMPTDFGFDRYYGLVDGCCNFFNPGLSTRPGEGPPGRKAQRKDQARIWGIEDRMIGDGYTPADKDFYTTDAFTDYAVARLEEYREEEAPFILYLAYTAPHYPLHAWPEDIEKYKDTYQIGWDKLRETRFERMREMGIIDQSVKFPERPDYIPAWDSLSAEEKEEQAYTMAVYAAMIDRMDQGIGKVLEKLRDTGKDENTLVIFLSDNGACAENPDSTPNIPPGLNPAVDNAYSFDVTSDSSGNLDITYTQVSESGGGMSSADSVDESNRGGAQTDMFDALAGLAAEICGMPIAVIALDEGDYIRFAGKIGLERGGCPKDAWLSRSLRDARQTLHLEGRKSDQFPLPESMTGVADDIGLLLGEPLFVDDDRPAGWLCVMDHTSSPVMESWRSALDRIGKLVVLQLATARKVEVISASERRLRVILDNEPESVTLLGLDFELLEMNPAGLRMIEADSVADMAGKTVLELIYPNYRSAFKALMESVREGKSGELEFEMEGLKGTHRWLETRATPMWNEDGKVISLLGISRDVTDRRLNLALLEGQRETLELIAEGAGLDETLPALARFIEEQSPGLLCSILLLDGDGEHLRNGTAPSLPIEYTSAIDGVRIGECVGSCGTAAFRREAVYVEDIAESPLWKRAGPIALKHGLRACWSTPIFDKEQEVCGTFAMYYREPGLPKKEHLRMIEIATNVAAIAIGRYREAETLRRNHQLLEGVMEGTTDAIYVKDLEGRYQFMNSAGARLANLTPQEVIGKTDMDLLPEESARIFRQMDEDVLATDGPITREQIGMMGDLTRILSANKTPWRDAEGKTMGVIGVSRDITESRKAEAELRAGEERFRLFMDHSPSTAWVKDEEGRYVYMNRPFEECFGAKLEDWQGKTDDEIWPGKMADDFRRNDLAVLKSGKALEAVEFARNAQGKVMHLLCSKFPFKDARGMRYVAGIGLDITERVEAEKELQRSEENYRTLVESASDGILVCDENKVLLDVNTAGCAMFGYTHKEMIGMHGDDICGDSPDNLLPKIDSLQPGEVVRSEWKTRRKDGTIFPSEVSLTVLPDGRTLAIIRDITERKKLEQQFLRVQRMDSIGTLAGGIAHDLNNALAPILMSLDLLKMKFPDPTSHELLGMIGASAQRGAEMVKQVLSFARGVEGERVDVDCGALIREVEKIANDTFMKNITVEVNTPPDLWNVAGDSTQLHQVLVNLCVNARDAMPEGGTLRLSAENHILDAHYVGMSFGTDPGPYILIRVEDNGKGMSQEVIENIFDPFYTTKEFGAGTGLGLSTSQAIVRGHGGFIQVYSDEGKGTRFNIYLPVRDCEDGATKASQPGLQDLRGRGELILVVEDEILVRQITRETLEAYGYRVILAADGADAVSVFANHKGKIAAVLTDMMMPVMDGPATIKVLHRLDPNLPIIATSGLSSSEHIDEVMRQGVSAFLAKPYTAEMLLQALRGVIKL
eukprot:g3969.t1